MLIWLISSSLPLAWDEVAFESPQSISNADMEFCHEILNTQGKDIQW